METSEETVNKYREICKIRDLEKGHVYDEKFHKRWIVTNAFCEALQKKKRHFELSEENLEADILFNQLILALGENPRIEVKISKYFNKSIYVNNEKVAFQSYGPEAVRFWTIFHVFSEKHGI